MNLVGSGAGVAVAAIIAAAAWASVGCASAPPPPETPLDMVSVPQGGFIMGSSDAQIEVAASLCAREVRKAGQVMCEQAAFFDEGPAHRVDLAPFFIDRHEVTAGDYARCVAAGACSKPGTAVYCTWGRRNADQLPINCVTWNQAVAFCGWQGKRLPTEAEWERAARGTDARSFPWGGQQPGVVGEPVGNFSDAVGVEVNPMWPSMVAGYDDGHAGPAPVMSFESGVSPVGAFDMAGNVWEWVADPYVEGGYDEALSPEARRYGRVIRGGGFSSPAVDVRASVRYVAPAMGSFNTVGFRCAMDLPMQEE